MGSKRIVKNDMLCLYKRSGMIICWAHTVIWCVCTVSLFSHVSLPETLWTVAHQAPWSKGFSRQEYWSGLPCPPLGDHPDPGIKPTSLMSPALAVRFFTTTATWEALFFNFIEVSVQFSPSVVSNSLQPHGLQHARLPCPSPAPRACSNSCPLSWWCHPTISLSVFPFSSCPNLSQHQGLFKWVSSSHQVAKVLEFQLQHQSFQWIFRTDFL